MPVFKATELGTKYRRFNGALPLGIPVHEGRVQEYKIAGLRSACQFVPGVISINVQTKVNVLTAWSWRILRNGLLHVPIKWCPIDSGNESY
jgi:hypothetical protein